MLCFLILVVSSLTAVAQWQSQHLDTVDVTGLSASDTRLFVGTIGGLHTSVDFGDHFTFSPVSAFCPVYQVAVNGNTLFSAISNGLRRSTTNGANWNFINALINFSVYSVIVHGAKIYAASQIGVHVSDNNGVQWTSISNGLPSLAPTTFITSSGSDLFAIADSTIFTSTNNGALWVAADSGLANVKVYALQINGSTLIAGTDQGIFVSNNQGAWWSSSNTGMPTTTVRSICCAALHVFAATDTGIFYSADNGNNWNNITANLPAVKIRHTVICGSKLFVALADMQAGGELWSRPLLDITGIGATAKKNELIVFPQPAKNELFIRSTDKVFQQAILYNSIGQSFPLAVENGRIDLQAIAGGSYILCLHDGKSVIAKQIVILK